ncbi:hypothetical protein L596_030599 [Steinernema carpocapsae]|uniref:Uncharacterized protein n=1 Tax=Steinernema carpocapsae TaxID=34508 RepID=A0A4V6XVK0_STECR|nr:hypothetical protein L596_030599 [Steinernema carpocapsae]
MVVKSCIRQFFKGISDVLAGVIVLLFRIDEFESKRQREIQKKRDEAAARRTPSRSAGILATRMRKQRAAEALATLGDPLMSSPEKQCGTVAVIVVRKMTSTYGVITDTGKRCLQPCRFRTLQCLLLSVFIVLSILGINKGLKTALNRAFPNQDLAVEVILVLFRAMIGAVQFCIMRVRDVVWFSDLNNAASNYREHVKNPLKQFYHLNTPTFKIADVLVSIVTLMLINIQVALVQHMPIPILSDFLYVFCLSLYYAAYAFDYRYMNQGIVQSARVRLIEGNWPYYLGFGFPLAFSICLTSNTIVCSYVDSAFLPILIISCYLSDPGEETPGVPAIPLFKAPLLASEVIFQRGVKWASAHV